MLSTTSALLVISLLTPVYILAANDWSVPCVSGSCTWDTGDGKTTAYSSMAIVRPTSDWDV